MAYATLADLKTALGRDPLPGSADSDLTRLLTVGASGIDLFCRRTFTLTSSTVTLDAPARIDLDVPDLQSVTNLTAYGTSLSVGTDYRLLTDDARAPYRLTTWAPHYTAIRRYASGVPVAWQSFAGGVPPDGAVTLVFSEGYAANTPDAVVLANIALASRLWLRRLNGYGDSPTDTLSATTQAAVGLIERDEMLVDLLTPLQRPL